MWKVDYQIRRHSEAINSVTLSNDMGIIMTASNDQTVLIFDRMNQDIELLEAHNAPILCVKLSPNGEMFATSSVDGTAKLWNLNSLENFYTCKTHKKSVPCVAWGPNSRQIVTASHDGTAVLWDVESFERLFIMNATQNWINDVQVYDNLVAVAANERYIPIYDKRTGKVVQKIQTNTEVDLSSLSFHHLGSCVAAGSKDGKVRIWDLRTTNVLRRQKAHADLITRIAFHPFADDYITSSRDGFCRIWSLKTTEIVASFQQHDSGINDVTWCNDGEHFATVGEDKKLCVYYQPEVNKDGFDGGDMLAALSFMQEQMRTLTDTMKRLDERLILQEEKIKFLQDIDNPITKASNKTRK